MSDDTPHSPSVDSEVLASERDPATAETFDEQDYRTVIQVLERFYNIILTDCGTGLSHSAMDGVLDLAHSLIIVSTAALDGARSASATLDWLEAHGYGHLVSRAVVVLSGPRRGSASIDLTQLAQHFLARTRAVQVIPFDEHLSEEQKSISISLPSRRGARSSNWPQLSLRISPLSATTVVVTTSIRGRHKPGSRDEIRTRAMNRPSCGREDIVRAVCARG